MNNVFSRLVVGVDDSDASAEAVAVAARLTRELNGQLILCHAVNWLPLATEMAASGAGFDPTPAIDDLKREGERELDEAVAAAKRDGVDAQRRSVEGEPAQRILDVAAESNCSAIVMGTNGRTGLARLFVGSTTETVLRGSTIPVLTVRAGTKLAPTTRPCFERILVGIDESEPSDAAVRTVLDFPASNARDVFFYSVAATVEDRAGYAKRAVDKATAAAGACGIRAEGCVTGGETAEALIAAAQLRDADLIVIGSHGRRGLERWFIGSVAESIVRTAPLPVLVVRTGKQIPLTADVAAAAEASPA